MHYNIFENKKLASEAAYKLIKSLLKEDSTIGFATGSSPLELYKFMIEDYKKKNVSYKNITSFNLDEYIGLPYKHKESYLAFMENNLFNHIDIKKENINIPNTHIKNLTEAVKNYQKKLNNKTIDIQILGVGKNGHIGFNEPGTSFDSGVHIVTLKQDTIKANSRFFNNDITLVPKQAVTMGIKDIMRSKHIILLAFGKDKQYAIKNLIEGDKVTEQIPCTILKKHPNVHIFVDKEADFK